MVPEGWTEKPIADLATLVNGRAYQRPEMLDAGVPILRIQNLKGGESWFYSDLELPEEKYCDSGDLLFAWSATFGPFLWRGPRAIYHYHIWKVLPKEGVLKQYLYHALDGITSQVKGRSQGGLGMLHMTKAGMEAWTLALPPLPEQRKIAEILTAVDETIEKTEAVIEQLGVVKKAMMQELLTRGLPGRHTRFKKTELGDIPEEWEVVTLGNVAEFINGRPFKPHEWSTAGLPIIRIQNINGGTDYNYFAGSCAPKYRVEPGDLLFAWSGSRGTSFGPHIWRGPTGLLNYHTWKVSFNAAAVHRNYLFYALRRATAKIEHDAHGASALVHMQKRFIVDYKIALPQPSEQAELARRLDAIETRASTEQDTVAALRVCKAALMSVLLTGELRVNPDEEDA